MRIPELTREVLQPFFNAPLPDVEITRGSVNTQLFSLAPRSMRPNAVMSVVGARAGLRTIGVSTHGHITLDPSHFDLNSAAGLALLAHEEVHQQQYLDVPNFDHAYEDVDRYVDRSRPWENPYELKAYQKERDVYCGLVQQGYPAGSWTPLGVKLWGCPIRVAAMGFAPAVLCVTG